VNALRATVPTSDLTTSSARSRRSRGPSGEMPSRNRVAYANSAIDTPRMITIENDENPRAESRWIISDITEKNIAEAAMYAKPSSRCAPLAAAAAAVPPETTVDAACSPGAKSASSSTAGPREASTVTIDAASPEGFRCRFGLEGSGRESG
jgi:hypothetical protein